MNENKTFLLSDYIFLDQMHDERVDEIDICENQLELVFNSLHFPSEKNYKSAKIMFKGFEDINSDAYIDIFTSEEKAKICYRKYIDEFVPYMHEQKLKLEIIDILTGKELVMITGTFVNPNGYYGDKFQLVVSAKEISYLFFTENPQ